jgi:hypothetical protein
MMFIDSWVVVVYGDRNTLVPDDASRWEMLKSMKMMMGKNQSSQSQVHVTAFGSTEG